MTRDIDLDYARAGFGVHLPFGRRPALVLVDVAQAYLQPGSALYVGPNGVVECLERVVQAARDAKVPVVFTKVVYQAGGIDGGLFYRKVPALKAFRAGSPLGEFPSRLRPEPDDLVIVKQYASAFFGTSLSSTLRTWGVDTVVLAGFSTSGCVRASATDAIQYGFIPYVVREGCGDRDLRPNDANLFDLQAKYAEVVGEEEICRLLRETGRAAAEAVAHPVQPPGQ